MKYLLVVIVVVVGLFLLLGRSRRRVDAAPPKPAPPAAPGAAAPMLACAHCGVHIPRADAVQDAAGRSFCTDEHRLAGPR